MFVKGKSGNPGGRVGVPAHVRDAARVHTPAAIQALADALTCDNPHARVKAAEVLLDRAWGKPPQAITGADGGPIGLAVVSRVDLSKLTEEELAALEALTAKIPTDDAGDPEGGDPNGEGAP